MNILEQLTSGALHAKARSARPDCVDTKGNIHNSPERAQFVDWLSDAKATWGDDTTLWTKTQKAELRKRHVAIK